MRKLFVILSLASVAVLGCTGGTSTSPTGKSSSPSATDGGKSATDGNSKPSAGGAGGDITPANTKIEFVGSAPDHKHDGGFKKVSGSIKPVDGDITKGTINVEIDLDSMWTDNDGKPGKSLTGHLKSPDFFDVKKYPTATFVSKEIKAEKKGNDTHVITGDLTLHGTTKPVSIPAKVTVTDDAVMIDGKFIIDRTEFGIGKNFPEDKLLKDVPITVSAKVARK